MKKIIGGVLFALALTISACCGNQKGSCCDGNCDCQKECVKDGDCQKECAKDTTICAEAKTKKECPKSKECPKTKECSKEKECAKS